MPNEERNPENSSDDMDRLKWNEIKWNQKFKRVLRNGKNVLIVGFGGSLGILVVSFQREDQSIGCVEIDHDLMILDL